jgi:hypothetical protein
MSAGVVDDPWVIWFARPGTDRESPLDRIEVKLAMTMIRTERHRCISRAVVDRLIDEKCTAAHGPQRHDVRRRACVDVAIAPGVRALARRDFVRPRRGSRLRTARHPRQ